MISSLLALFRSHRQCRLTRLSVVFLFVALPLFAQLPEAPIKATIEVSNRSPFVKETILVTLTVITRDIDISQNLNVADLPPPERWAIIDAFKPLPIQRKIDGPHRIETRRYQARARALLPGKTPIVPTLHVTVQRRVRAFFGSAIEERPVSIPLPEVTLIAKPLPPPPQDFTGAVGRFNVNINVSPTNLVAGDLLTVTTTLSGEGFLDDLLIPEVPGTPLLKTYPVKEQQAEPQRRRFVQTVIPTSEAIDAIPAVSLSVFDTETGDYITHTTGPVPLNYHRASTRVIEQFRPGTGGRTNAPNADSRTGSWRQRLAEGRHVSVRCSTETSVHLAPAFRSLSTFVIPADTDAKVLERHKKWLLVEYQEDRGWIHQDSLAADGQHHEADSR